MKKFLSIFITIAVTVSISTSALAAEFRSPLQITADLTGKTVEEVINEQMTTGKSFITIINDAGKLEEFKSEILQEQKTILDNRVDSGILTRSQADQILSEIEASQNLYNPDENYNYGYGMGHGYGGMGYGHGMGHGYGYGYGHGHGGCGMRYIR